MATKKLFSMLLLSILVVLPIAGCWDAVDINDRNTLTAVVVDKTDYGYAFYVEIPMIAGGSQNGEGGGSQKKQPAVVRSEGRTYAEARENLDKAMDKPIYLGAVQSVIFTDRLASFGIEEYVLRLRQAHDYRKTTHVVVTTEAPESLLKEVPANAESVGFSIEQTLMSLINTGQLHHVSLMNVLESLSAPYKHFILPTVALVDTEPAFTGFTVFSGGMKTGFIPAAEIKSICFILVPKPKMMYTVPFKDTYAAVQVLINKRSIKPNYSGEKISFDMSLQFKAILQYPEKVKPVTGKDMEVIKSTLQAMLEQEFIEMFKKSQEVYQYDCYNLHTPFRVSYPEAYKNMDWASEYRKVTLNLTVKVDLSPTDAIDYNPEE